MRMEINVPHILKMANAILKRYVDFMSALYSYFLVANRLTELVCLIRPITSQRLTAKRKTRNSSNINREDDDDNDDDDDDDDTDDEEEDEKEEEDAAVADDDDEGGGVGGDDDGDYDEDDDEEEEDDGGAGAGTAADDDEEEEEDTLTAASVVWYSKRNYFKTMPWCFPCLHLCKAICCCCCLVGWFTSQQHASAPQGRIWSDTCTCCHTEIEVADQTFYLIQSQYTDTLPTGPSTDPVTSGARQGSHWSTNFQVTGMTRPGKTHTTQAGIGDLPFPRWTP